MSQNLQENNSAGISFSIRLQALGLWLYWKEALTQKFSCEFCKIFKNTNFVEHLRYATSENTSKKTVTNEVSASWPLLLEVSILSSLVTINLMRVGTKIFQIVTGLYGKSAPCLVSCPWVLYKWRYDIFYLLCDLTKPPHWGVMYIFGWKLLTVYHQPDKSGDHMHCDSWYIIFLSRDLMWPHV